MRTVRGTLATALASHPPAAGRVTFGALYAAIDKLLDSAKTPSPSDEVSAASIRELSDAHAAVTASDRAAGDALLKLLVSVSLMAVPHVVHAGYTRVLTFLHAQADTDDARATHSTLEDALHTHPPAAPEDRTTISAMSSAVESISKRFDKLLASDVYFSTPPSVAVALDPMLIDTAGLPLPLPVLQSELYSAVTVMSSDTVRAVDAAVLSADVSGALPQVHGIGPLDPATPILWEETQYKSATVPDDGGPLPLFQAVLKLYEKEAGEGDDTAQDDDAMDAEAGRSKAAAASGAADGDAPSASPPDAAAVQRARVLRLAETDRRLLDEFRENALLLAGAHPSIIPAGGEDIFRNGAMPLSDSHWLLSQYDPAIGECTRFIFILVNQWQRHTGLQRFALCVRNNDVSFEAFFELSRDPATPALLRAAVASPNAPESVALASKLDRIFTRFDALVPGSAAARKGKLGDFAAMCRHFAYSVIFETTAPDPLGDRGAMRTTYWPASNRGFPARDCGFADAVASCGEFDDGNPAHGGQTTRLTYNALITRMVRNVAASAASFGANLDAHCEHLRGMPIEGGARKTKKTTVMGKRRVGLYGRVAAFMSTIEDNKKGWLHAHELECAGLPSWALQTLASVPELAVELARVVDVWVTAELSGAVHLQSILRRLLGLQGYRAPWADESTVVSSVAASATDPSAASRVARVPLSALDLHTQQAAERVNVHTHGTRCHEGVMGCKECSQAHGKELRPGNGSAGADKLLDVYATPPTWGPVPPESPPPRTAINPLGLSNSVVMVEPTRGLPGPGAIPRISTNYAVADDAELDAALEAALAEVGDVRGAQDARRAGGTGGVMDRVSAEELDAALDAMRESDTDTPLPVAIEAALRDLIGAVNSGGIAKAESLRAIISALPPAFQACIRRTLLARNTRITDHNAVLTALKGCNTAVYILSSGIAAAVATLYTLDYITKGQTARSSTLAIALDLHEKAKKVRQPPHPLPFLLTHVPQVPSCSMGPRRTTPARSSAQLCCGCRRSCSMAACSKRCMA